ncbi:hypothetical protein SK128_026099, partial [Halocaridina rubra]
HCLIPCLYQSITCSTHPCQSWLWAFLSKMSMPKTVSHSLFCIRRGFGMLSSIRGNSSGLHSMDFSPLVYFSSYRLNTVLVAEKKFE